MLSGMDLVFEIHVALMGQCQVTAAVSLTVILLLVC